VLLTTFWLYNRVVCQASLVSIIDHITFYRKQVDVPNLLPRQKGQAIFMTERTNES
jgi:hypothetical protein